MTEKNVTTEVKTETEKKVKEPKPKKETTVKKEPKKKTVKKHKTRTVEELVQAATKSMTDKEKTILINHLHDMNKTSNLKIEALKINCEKAYAQARELEEQYKSMEDHYRSRLAYVDEQTKAFLKAITLATRGGLK